MNLNDVINNRRSIRRFKDTKVTREDILSIIECAQNAPSWKNSQVSRYYVVEEKRDEVIASLPDFNKFSVANAPVFIISTVVNNRSGYDREGNPETHLIDGFSYFDNGLQIENLVLKATELGLGTLIMGLYDNEVLRTLLEIPENETITVVIALGEKDIEPQKPQRKVLTDITKFY